MISFEWIQSLFDYSSKENRVRQLVEQRRLAAALSQWGWLCRVVACDGLMIAVPISSNMSEHFRGYHANSLNLSLIHAYFQIIYTKIYKDDLKWLIRSNVMQPIAVPISSNTPGPNPLPPAAVKPIIGNLGENRWKMGRAGRRVRSHAKRSQKYVFKAIQRSNEAMYIVMCHFLKKCWTLFWSLALQKPETLAQFSHRCSWWNHSTGVYRLLMAVVSNGGVQLASLMVTSWWTVENMYIYVYIVYILYIWDMYYVCNGMEWKGMERRNGMGWDGMECNAMQCNVNVMICNVCKF